MLFVMGTTTVTACVHLNAVVISFTVVFRLLKARCGDEVRDMSSSEEVVAQATQVV